MRVNQFNENPLRDTPSGATSSYFDELNCDAKRNIDTCERKGLSIYFDLFLSSEARIGTDSTDAANELKAANMEPSEHNRLAPSCMGGDSHKDLQTNGLTPHTDSLNAGLKGSEGKDLKSVAIKSNVEIKGQGNLSMKQVARQCHGKFDQKQYGKRVGTQLERETPQVKKSRLTTSKVEPFKIKKDGLISPAVIVHDESASSRKIKSPDEGQLDVLPKQGVGVLSGVNPVELAVISKAQPKFRAQDITKEEAAFELQQCVLLLQKYGVLNTREYYLSQSFPSCAPHPGFAGDKHLSKRCKICRVLEDSNSTVICDECQESFHLSCCLPRLNPKHFDREDDWYCSSCKKQKRRMGRFYDIGRADGRGGPAGMSFISKVKLGTAYQANVPLWTGSADDGSLGKSSNEALFGMEEPLAEEAKENEKRRLLNEFELKAEKWRKQLANSTCVGTPENWLQCRSVVVKPFKDFDGNKHSETVCGKWRRAPSNIQQFERWECFCAIEWDPCHADCAVPQELPTEEILRRMQVKKDLQPSEVLEGEP